MTPLQKNVYRSILSMPLSVLQSYGLTLFQGQNFELLKTLTEPTRTKYNNFASKANMNNMLMQLRK
jgi:hypothetical protein